MYWQNIINHLRKLLDFQGRESVGSFWPYCGTVIVFLFLAWGAYLGWALPELKFGPVQTEYSATGIHAHAQLIEPFPAEFFSVLHIWLIGIFTGHIVLLAAAVARRLHDRNSTGLWGLMPIPFIVFSAAYMPDLFAMMAKTDTPTPEQMKMFFMIFFSNGFYLMTLAILAIMLMLPGRPGHNRYGPESASDA